MRSPDVPPLVTAIQYGKDFRLSGDVEGIYPSGAISFTKMIVDNDGIVLKARIVGALKDIAFGGHKDIWVLQSAVGIEDIFPEETRALEGIVVNDSRDMPRLTVSQDNWCNPGTIFIEVKASLKFVSVKSTVLLMLTEVKPKDQRPFTFGDIVNCEVEMRREDIEIPSGLNMSGFFKRVYRLKLTAVSHYLSVNTRYI